MAHEIESMFFNGETPWHGLGVRLPEAPTTGEAIRAAGLDWHVITRPCVTVDGVPVPAQATVRESDGRVLGVVGPAYEPLQNREAFAFFDPLVAAGDVTLETAGSLRDGQRVWVLARLARDPVVIVKQADDVVLRYLLLSNSHDGTLAVRVGFCPIRVVCANTMAIAHEHATSKLLRIKHTKGVNDTLTEIREAMNLASAEFEATAEQLRRLAATPIVADDLKKYVKRVFELGDADDAQDEAGKRILSRVTPLFEEGRGNDLPGVRGTLWAAYNSVTEYLLCRIRHKRYYADSRIMPRRALCSTDVGARQSA